MIDELDEEELELAMQALEEIRGEPFDLSDDDERELREREDACARGEKQEARSLLAALKSR